MAERIERQRACPPGGSRSQSRGSERSEAAAAPSPRSRRSAAAAVHPAERSPRRAGWSRPDLRSTCRTQSGAGSARGPPKRERSGQNERRDAPVFAGVLACAEASLGARGRTVCRFRAEAMGGTIADPSQSIHSSASPSAMVLAVVTLLATLRSGLDRPDSCDRRRMPRGGDGSVSLTATDAAQDWFLRPKGGTRMTAAQLKAKIRNSPFASLQTRISHAIG